MSRVAYVNGAYVPHADAVLPIDDRATQFGDAVYEVVFIRSGRFVDETLHLDRLDRSLRELRLEPPMGRAALRHVLVETARRNRVRNGLVYLQISRGVARRDHAFPRPGTPPSLIVTARTTRTAPADPATWATAAITRPDERWGRCDIKSVNLLPNVLAKQAARDAGAGEAIFIAADGRVTEGGSTSVWVVDAEGRLRLPRLDHAILPGCTRAALLTLMEGEGIACETRAVTADELADAQEIFLTSATALVRPITAVDGRPVGTGGVGPITARLYALLARHAAGDLRNEAH